MNRWLIALALSPLLIFGVQAQDLTAKPAAGAPEVPTTYRVSEVVSAQVKRHFLESIRWSSGLPLRNMLSSVFEERSPNEIWQQLVEQDGLKLGDAADALTAYWVLNWITANAAYDVVIDHAAVQSQVRAALGNDANFRAMNDRQKQEMAEGYILNFLLEHAALRNAVARKDTLALYKLANAAALRFQKNLGIDLLALEPGPAGFTPRQSPGTGQ